MHRDLPRPQSTSGEILLYECCDVKRDSGERDPTLCEIPCVWQRMTPFSLFAWNLFCSSVESFTDDKKVAHYSIEPKRFEVAMVMHRVRKKDWLDAHQWIAFACEVATNG